MGRRARLAPLTEEQMLNGNAKVIDALYSRLDSIVEALPLHADLFNKICEDFPIDNFDSVEFKSSESPPRIVLGAKTLEIAPGSRAAVFDHKVVIYKNKNK